MTIKDRLMADFKEAMKTKDEIAKNTISFARAAIKQYEVDNREELSDEGIMAVLSKQVKMRKDALADFEKAGRTDLADSYKAAFGGRDSKDGQRDCGGTRDRRRQTEYGQAYGSCHG